MKTRFCEFVIFAVLCLISCAESAMVCPVLSVSDSIPRVRCYKDSYVSVDYIGVVEGDEASLQKALTMVNKQSHNYVAILFYASWCPFSASFKPMLSILSSLYPSIPHFAVEESVIRPSILSKYGVHGFPTLFLLNSSMRVRYRGSRTLGSLAAFYDDVTGLKSVPLDSISLEKIILCEGDDHNSNEPESCPFSWAKSPENLLCQDTYLALATSFVLLRLLYIIFPTLLAIAKVAWTRHIRNKTLGSLVEHPRAYLHRALHLLNYLREPRKRRNLQERAMNAKAWASKSLASVSFGETSKLGKPHSFGPFL